MIESIIPYRRQVVVLIQLILVFLAYLLSFVSRFDYTFIWGGQAYNDLFYRTLPALIIIRMASCWYFDLFRGLWKYVSISDLKAIVSAAFIGTVLFAFYLFLVENESGFPRSILLIDFAYNIILFGGIRMLVRIYRESKSKLVSGKAGARKKIIIIGAGDAGEIMLREMLKNPGLGYDPVGFADDDKSKIGKTIHGYKILGNTEDIPRLVEQLNIDEVLIAMPSITGDTIRRIVEGCKMANIQFKTLPFVGDLIDGNVSVSQIREVSIEDLLGRESVHLDLEMIGQDLKDKVIMVTGAAGSIGSELVRQVARFRPHKIILFERGENDLYHIEMELKKKEWDTSFIFCVGDVRDKESLNNCMSKYRPSHIFHAAAYKHVPMMEMNSVEAVKNNALGTKTLVDVAIDFGVEKFILISTDKAVRPTNVMGATKRIAEMILQAKSSDTNCKTHFISVRFGNVLGSNGSVIPLFKKQIQEGGPITVTHPEIKRYFMTIPEAVQLVIQAGAMGKGGELFLLEMGEAVKIKDLAESLVRLSGLAPVKDIDIIYTGLRPGEKLYEELMNDGESVKDTGHDKIRIIQADQMDVSTAYENIQLLQKACDKGNIDELMTILKLLVPDYKPSSYTNIDLDQIYDYEKSKDNIIIH